MQRYIMISGVSRMITSPDDLARMDNIAPDGGYFFTRITDKKNKTLLLPAVDGEYWLGAIAGSPIA